MSDLVGNPEYRFSHNEANFILKFQQQPEWSGEELMHGLKYVRPGNGFVPNFPLTQKTDVIGGRQHPLYTYLKVQNVGIYLINNI